MAFIIGKIRCYFCEKKGGIIHSVHAYGIYGEIGKRIFYHPECLEMIQMEPEKFGHKWADKAIQISELMEEIREDFNVKLVQEWKDKVSKLHKLHFSRMMPRKR